MTYLTVKEVATQLAVATDHVLALIHNNHLRAVNVAVRTGKPRWRISTDDLDVFLAARTACQRPSTRRRPRKRKPQNVIEFF